MRLYRTSVKEDINICNVFQHLAENYVNQVKSVMYPPLHHFRLLPPPPQYSSGGAGSIGGSSGGSSSPESLSSGGGAAPMSLIQIGGSDAFNTNHVSLNGVDTYHERSILNKSMFLSFTFARKAPTGRTPRKTTLAIRCSRA